MILRHPISVITKQDLETRPVQELNLGCSEFLVWRQPDAITSKWLLQRPETAPRPGTGNQRDRWCGACRAQKFKAAAELLHDKETLRSAQYARPDARIEAIAGDDYEPEIEVDLFSLLSAFRQVLERARERPPVPLPAEQISIETRIEQLLERLSETRLRLSPTCSRTKPRRTDMIFTFPGDAGDDPPQADRVSSKAAAGAIRTTSARAPRTRRNPIHDPEDEYKCITARKPNRIREPERTEDKKGRETPRRPRRSEDGLAQLKAVIESLMFASPEPLTPRMLYGC